jgi:DNA polymerase-1
VSAPLLAADVPWLLYRSFFALPSSIRGADGAPVNALLGTVNAILALIEGLDANDRPRAVLACMGAEQADYRVRLYEPYHAHRDPMPPELAHQWQQAPALLERLGWTHADSATLEADDVMFSLARIEEGAGGRALLLTGDRDLYGAVSDAVAFVELGRGGAHTLLGPARVRERYGVPPQLVPDFIALRGDPSDGLPGAPGIGAKTAAELLREHGSLEALLAAAQKPAGVLRPRVAGVLQEHGEQLRAFKQIATLQHIELERPADRATDYAGGAAAAAELGMKRLSERLGTLATA